MTDQKETGTESGEAAPAVLLEPTPRRLSREERREQTRERLLDAAARVFAQHGYASASLDQVAEAAGYTKGAVYSNFASKSDLFIALVERRILEQTAASAEALRGLSLADAVAALEARIASDSPPLDPSWMMLVCEFWLSAMRDERIRRLMAEQYERARTITADMLAAKFAEAGMEPPMAPRDLAIVIEALGVGLGFQNAVDPDGVPMRLQVDVLLRLLRSGSARGGSSGAAKRSTSRDSL